MRLSVDGYNSVQSSAARLVQNLVSIAIQCPSAHGCLTATIISPLAAIPLESARSPPCNSSFGATPAPSPNSSSGSRQRSPAVASASAHQARPTTCHRRHRKSTSCCNPQKPPPEAPRGGFFLLEGVCNLKNPPPLQGEARSGGERYSHPPKASYCVAPLRRTTAYCLQRRALSETFGG